MPIERLFIRYLAYILAAALVEGGLRFPTFQNLSQMTLGPDHREVLVRFQSSFKGIA